MSAGRRYDAAPRAVQNKVPLALVTDDDRNVGERLMPERKDGPARFSWPIVSGRYIVGNPERAASNCLRVHLADEGNDLGLRV